MATLNLRASKITSIHYYIDSPDTAIDVDVGGNMTFTDSNSGSATLGMLLGGGVQFDAVIVDMGVDPVYNKTFEITNSLVNSASLVFGWKINVAVPGKTQDELEMDELAASCTPLDGKYNLVVSALSGPVVGNFAFCCGVKA